MLPILANTYMIASGMRQRRKTDYHETQRWKERRGDRRMLHREDRRDD